MKTKAQRPTYPRDIGKLVKTYDKLGKDRVVLLTEHRKKEASAESRSYEAITADLAKNRDNADKVIADLIAAGWRYSSKDHFWLQKKSRAKSQQADIKQKSLL